MFTTQPEKTSFIEEVARLVSQKGLEIEKTLVIKDNGKKFSFLLSSYREPAGVSLEDVYIMKLTAQFIARYDTHFLRALKEHVAQNPKPQFEFLKPTSSRFNFCRGLVRGYSSVIRPCMESLMRDGGGMMPLVLTFSECWTGHPDMPQCLQFFFHRLQLEKLEAGDKMAMIDLHAFVSGVDLFAERDNHAFGYYYDDDTKPELIYAPLSYEILEKQLTLKELGIIKVTAMFVARYGENFRRDLMETVFMNPLFEFLRPTDCKCSSFFTSLLRVYSTVIMPSDMLWNGDDSTAYALEFFSSWRSSRTVRRRLLLICMGLWVVLTVLVT
ncbi:hypothetical protein Bca52824_055945 [Brassica carinata]|uniref:SURP motif domain-containing protein n=1 Tax=Brassica carinata TaxID=52824 RepID=A0A8X7RCR7_BRACI|nr:hypothetical protein Bca52824_055945 [Brassica carinata]